MPMARNKQSMDSPMAPCHQLLSFLNVRHKKSGENSSRKGIFGRRLPQLAPTYKDVMDKD